MVILSSPPSLSPHSRDRVVPIVLQMTLLSLLFWRTRDGTPWVPCDTFWPLFVPSLTKMWHQSSFDIIRCHPEPPPGVVWPTSPSENLLCRKGISILLTFSQPVLSVRPVFLRVLRPDLVVPRTGRTSKLSTPSPSTSFHSFTPLITGLPFFPSVLSPVVVVTPGIRVSLHFGNYTKFTPSMFWCQYKNFLVVPPRPLLESPTTHVTSNFHPFTSFVWLPYRPRP